MQNVPQVFAGRFRVESLLGQGGMGSVYAATDLSIGRKVAIKVLHPELAAIPDHLERLREEAFSLASLHHPNIVQLFDFHSGGPDGAFMVMELVEGETLASRLMREPVLSFDVGVDYALQVLSALAAAHSRGIVHRDIKPANLLVQSVPARRDLIKVLDFGIAKLTEETIRRRPTTAGILMGTPTYMAPEQASGRPVDPRTDIHAVGLILYRMLSGMNPFEGYDLPTTLYRVTSVDPPPLSRLRADAPEFLVHAIARAVSKDPATRFQNVMEFAQTLGADQTFARRMSGPPPAAPPELGHPATVSYPPGPGVPPHLAQAPANAAALVRATPEGRPLAVQAGAVPQTMAAASAAPRGGDVAASGGGKGVVWIGIGVGFLVVVLIGLTGAVAWLLSKQNASSTTPAPSAPSPALLDASVAPADAGNTGVVDAGNKVVVGPAPAALSSKPVKETGTCSCLPREGSVGHGNNQRLSPKFPTRFECSCIAPSQHTLCVAKAVGGRCKRVFVGKPGDPCTGFIAETGEAVSGATMKDCVFDSTLTDVYPGPRGRPCKGFMHTGAHVDGDTFCFPSR